MLFPDKPSLALGFGERAGAQASSARGTNNARLAGMLRNLSGYYAKEPTLLLLVRAAQGLVHMGKGLLGLAPYHTDGQLASGAPVY